MKTEKQFAVGDKVRITNGYSFKDMNGVVVGIFRHTPQYVKVYITEDGLEGVISHLLDAQNKCGYISIDKRYIEKKKCRLNRKAR